MIRTATAYSGPAVDVDPHGELIEPTTLKIERLLPGPIERCWAFLTESDLRRQWLAAGDMPLEVGAEFELVWRNDELTDPPGRRPDGFDAEHRLTSRILAVDPPRRLAFTFGGAGEVEIDLAPVGDAKVLLTLVHRWLPDRAMLIKVAAGWHVHLDVLVARAEQRRPEGPFWDVWGALKDDYDRRLPG